MNISLFYFKVLDDVKDDKDLKSKFLSLTLLPYKKKILHYLFQKINKYNKRKFMDFCLTMKIIKLFY